MYRNDPARSGYTAKSLPTKLQQAWVYRAAHAPQSAWPRSDRLTFDRANQPVIAGDLVYFGDSVTGVVTALDLGTGQTRWQFFTEGPIRFAPAVFEDRLFVTSDDGHLYALQTTTGALLWKHRGGPDAALRLGNERMISRWPARGGAVVVGDTVHYAAGIWPTEGIFLYALDARSGEPRWVNDNSGGIYMPQPHGGANAESGIAAQGHLVATQTKTTNSRGETEERDWLLVPTGRAVPAAFNRATGDFEYFHLQQYGQKGGASVVAAGRYFLNSGLVFDTVGGQGLNAISSGAVVATPQGLVEYVNGEVIGSRWTTVVKKDRKGDDYDAPGLETLWKVGGLPVPREMIMADNLVIVGAKQQVLSIDSQSRQVVWQAPVEGNVLGLAVSDGRLLASTDTGAVYCFQSLTLRLPTAANTKANRAETTSESDSSDIETAYRKLAAQMLSESGVRAGYCLDFGCGDGRLSAALAEQSELQIIAIDTDAAQLAEARRRLFDQNLLGSRVTVLAVSDLADTALPNYFANLIVSQRGLDVGRDALPAEWERLQRPYGGVALLGSRENLERLERGPLAGAGQWTHQYSTPGNATCSTDELIKGPLGVLWFRDIDLDMPQRHGRGPGPLFYDGRLYSLGLHELACVDAYNGRLLWKYPLPNILKAYDGDELMGTAGTHSNYCVADSGVYVRRENHCLRLDRITGERLQQFDAPTVKSSEEGQPDKPGTWGFIACQDGILIGSLADPEHVVTFRYVNRGGDMNALLTESKTLFGMDAKTGEVLWKYEARDSIRHNAIAFDGDGVYLIDRPQALFDRTKGAKADYHKEGQLIALDAKTGATRWQNYDQIDGTLLAISEQHPVLMMGFQPTRFALESEVGGGLATFNLKTGEQHWRQKAKYDSRPMINDRTIYSQGGSWDLLTGKEQPFPFQRSYGCGVLAGSKHMMVFRSATLGYFDFERQEKTENFGGVRPGCWINAIPAGGLVLVPDASSGCVCSYLNQSWFALEPDGVRPPKITPTGGAFRDRVTVTLTPDEPELTVRYTLDGTSPTKSSPLYGEPLQITAATMLKARSFDANGRPGRMSEASFQIDPRLLPVEDEFWTVWDVSGKNLSAAPSRWSVDGGVISQTSNIYQGSATDSSPLTERLGTLRICQHASGTEFTNGTIDWEMRSEDDDGIGLIFRVQDDQRYYLFASDKQRNFSILAVKNGKDYRVLATVDRAYQVGKWHRYGITLQGDAIQVELDGQPLLSARDTTFTKGTVGLYSWGSDNVQYRAVRLQPAESVPAP